MDNYWRYRQNVETYGEKIAGMIEGKRELVKNLEAHCNSTDIEEQEKHLSPSEEEKINDQGTDNHSE